MAEGALFADLQRLEDHCERIRKEQRLAELLCEKLRLMAASVSPETAEQYAAALSEAETLKRYLQKTAAGLDEIHDTLCDASVRISVMLKDNLDRSDPYSPLL